MDEMPAAQVQREAIMFKGFVSVNTPEDQTPVTLIVQNQLQYEKLVSMAQEIHQDPKNYEKIKAQLNIKSDFCLFFEDSEGNILPLILPSNDDETTLIVYGVGNPELNFKLNDTIVCGQVYKVNRADGSLSRYTS